MWKVYSFLVKLKAISVKAAVIWDKIEIIDLRNYVISTR